MSTTLTDQGTTISIVCSGSVLARELLSLLSAAVQYWPGNCCLYCLQCLLAKEVLSLLSAAVQYWPGNCCLYCLQCLLAKELLSLLSAAVQYWPYRLTSLHRPVSGNYSCHTVGGNVRKKVRGERRDPVAV